MTDEKKPNRSLFVRNWLSLAGSIIVLGSIFAFLLLFGIDLFWRKGNPYVGILSYVVAPFFFLLGSSLVFFGWLIARRQGRKSVDGVLVRHPLVIDLSRKRDRRILGGFIGGAVAFLFITAIGSTRTYHFTESVEFCGTACHTPMKPQFVAYQNSPHARVACTECHIGPGAKHYVKAKVNGVHQLVCTLTGDYDRPIKTPIKNLRPAQDTCEQCHWPQNHVGNLDRTYSHFLADETNTHFAVRLLLKVGGGDPTRSGPGGIHWHMNLSNKVEYVALDPQRQQIPWVRVTNPQGVVTEYRVPDFTANPANHEIRTMDCMDCHNRPAHQFRSPNDAVDIAMTAHRINSAIPWIKSNVVTALVKPYATEDQALKAIEESLSSQYPNRSDIRPVIAEAQQIFRNNFFPEMKTSWRSSPNNISHKEWAGCFRCHDGRHKSVAANKTISATDCNSCHTILAQGTGANLDKLSASGQPFFHIDSEYSDFSCNECHTGGLVGE